VSAAVPPAELSGRAFSRKPFDPAYLFTIVKQHVRRQA